MVRAGSNGGDVQPMTASWNPGGYRRWVVESTHVTCYLVNIYMNSSC